MVMEVSRRGDRRTTAGSLARGLSLGLIFAGALWAQPASASEGGFSFYPLGVGVPDAALMPPVQGVYYANVVYDYRASAGASQDFEFGGHVVAGVKMAATADFNFTQWVPTTNFAGGTAALGVALIPG